MFGKYTIVLVCFFIGVNCFSQEKRTKSQIATAQENIQIFLNRPQPEFAAALPLLLELINEDKDNLGYNYALGYCYINLDDEKALPYLEFCLQKPKEFADELYYYAARAYHLGHDFEKALIFYEKFRLTIKKPEKHQKKIDEIYHQEKLCENGIMLMSKKSELEIVNLGDNINTEYPEYGPIFDADQTLMLFTSCRSDTKGGGIDKIDGRYFEDIYISRKNKNGEWNKASNIGDLINTSGNDAVVAMSPDGQKIYLYKYAEGHGDLYSCELTGENWSAPVKLPEPINSNNWEPSLSVAPDENTIYFTSNRPGGFGGTDIYVVKKLPNGEWALPMNLGENVNSSHDEDSPFILADGKTLYFSSNGDKSMGGYDVFVTTLDIKTREWSEPENMGYPINTAHDDLYFSISSDGEKMYFSSNYLEGKGDKDIYYAKIKKKSVNVMLVKGKVVDEETGEAITAHIEVLNSETNELIGIYNSNEKTGEYTIIFQENETYTIEITSEVYTKTTSSLQVPLLDDFEVNIRNFKLLKSTTTNVE